MHKFKQLTIFLFLFAEGTFAQSGIFYNVKDFGAKGDGQTIDTPAIDAAITAASKAGGGTVFFPAGTYLSFTIHLKSFITLNLDNGATLEAADVKKHGLGNDLRQQTDRWYSDSRTYQQRQRDSKYSI